MPEPVELEGLDELDSLLKRLPDMAMAAAESAMNDALIYLHGQLPDYPPPPGPGLMSGQWTDKQRRWFFWALRTGKITVPYRRAVSAGLGGSFTTAVTRTEGALEGVIGTGKPYAPWVVGRDRQAAIHQSRWWIFEDVIDANLDGAAQEFKESFFKHFDELIGQEE